MSRILMMLAVLAGVNLSAHAYYTTMDTGEIIPEGHYRALIESNVAFNDMPGLNLVGKFDFGFNESSNFRVLLGGGAVGLQTGLLYKWIPFPDVDDQPAIGLLGGFVFARDEGRNYMNFRFHPLASKKFETEQGLFTPMVALPFGFTFTEGKTLIPLQFTAGSQWRPNGLEKLSFMAELGLNMHESFSYVAASVILDWDGADGPVFH